MASSHDIYTGRVGARMGRGAPLLMGATVLQGVFFPCPPGGFRLPASGCGFSRFVQGRSSSWPSEAQAVGGSVFWLVAWFVRVGTSTAWCLALLPGGPSTLG